MPSQFRSPLDDEMLLRSRVWSPWRQWGRPTKELMLEEDLIDLGWHQKEFQLRPSFDYAVMSLDECRLLGCVGVDPPTVAYDAKVDLWVQMKWKTGWMSCLIQLPNPGSRKNGHSTRWSLKEVR